jgi:hypothetical protein
MTETPQAAPVTTQAATPVAAPAAPAIDPDALVREVSAKLEKSLDEKNKKFAEDLAGRIAGKEQQKPANPIHVALAQKPNEFLQEFAAEVKKTTKEELRNEEAEGKRQAKLWQDTMAPHYEEVPDLKKHDYELMGQLTQVMHEPGSADLPFDQVVKKAVERAVGKHGLKKLSEEERKAAAEAAFVPGPAGAGYPAVRRFDPDSSDSKQKYIQKLRTEMQSYRVRKAPAAA